ncbi:lasso peptide biosynthesis B2 protein [Sphaerisporangium sp. NPDC051017]|uniref:lasso peptide biosynthesis B2 protein n=1 Tax=Sphaerisporangium sp. NPDC051017 TaxID=3154636 RepID=UPI00343292D8
MSSHMVLPAVERVSAADRLVGLAAFTAGIVLLSLPFSRMVRVIAWIKRHRPRPATPQEARTAAAAARWAGQWFPGRAACLENSVAAVLAAAIRGRAVHWCVGGRLAPYSTHAWIETDTGPAGEPANPDRPYLTLLRI